MKQAIIDAANQIVVPTFVATLSIAIVWLPLFHLGGVAGCLFIPMAEAVIFAMFASFLLSRTLVPTMAKYMMRSHHVPSRMSIMRHACTATPLLNGILWLLLLGSWRAHVHRSIVDVLRNG